MIEVNYLPECWTDDVRMSSLFSSFRSKDVNPKDWESKMNFWTDLILDSCKQIGNYIFDYTALVERFKRKGTIPLGLTTVIDELLRIGKIKPLSEVQNDLRPASWTNWGLKVFIQKPFSWAFYSILNVQKCQVDKEKFVIIENIKEMAASMKRTIEEQSQFCFANNLIEYEDFRKLFKDINEESFDLCLLQLIKEKSVALKEVPGKYKILKFSRKLEKQPPAITDVDIGIINLKKAEIILEKQIETVTENMKKYSDEAKYYLKEGSKLAAKNSLRKKCRCQKLLEKYENSKDVILTLLQNIEQAESDKTVLDAYQSGVKAFKNSLDANNISVSSVEDVMVDVQESLDIHEEIQESMKLPEEPDNDLESELADLLNEVPEVTSLSLPENIKNSDSLFPDVPSFDPQYLPSSAPSMTATAAQLPDVPTFDLKFHSSSSRSNPYYS